MPAPFGLFLNHGYRRQPNLTYPIDSGTRDPPCSKAHDERCSSAVLITSRSEQLQVVVPTIGPLMILFL